MFHFRSFGRVIIATHPVTGVQWVFWSKAAMLIGTASWLR